MDKRIKNVDHARDIAARDQFYADLAAGKVSIGEAVARMRRLSKLTQPEFAKHRGLSVQSLRLIEADRANPTVETLSKIASIFGLEVGFVPMRARAASTPAGDSNSPTERTSE